MSRGNQVNHYDPFIDEDEKKNEEKRFNKGIVVIIFILIHLLLLNFITEQSVKHRFRDYIENPENESYQKDFKKCVRPLLQSTKFKDSEVLTNKELLYDGKVINEVAKADKNPAMLKWLLDMPYYKDKDINGITDGYKYTPLHEAAASDKPEIVRFLLKEKGAGPLVQDNKCQTPLHLAARYNSNDAIEAFLRCISIESVRNDVIEAKNKYDQTPLFVAAMFGRAEAAKTLVQWGANPSVKSKIKLKSKDKEKNAEEISEMCLTYMIENMEEVALEALKTPYYYEEKLRERQRWYHLDNLEPYLKDSKLTERSKKHLTPLVAITRANRLQLVNDPVISKFIHLKWINFARFWTCVCLTIDIIYCVLWTILGTITRWYNRPFYTFPQDGWRVFFYVVLSGITIYFIVREGWHIYVSYNLNKRWTKTRRKALEKVRSKHPVWKNMDDEFIISQSENMKPYKSEYFRDFWNIIDWITYSLVIVNVVTHIADVTIPFRQPPCCSITSNATCDVQSVGVCDDGYVNNTNLSVWNNRIFVLTLISLWFRLLKYMRAFGFFGTFIAMLKFIVTDILRFFGIFLIFLIPFACGFWMVFGEISTIPEFFSFDVLFFTLFRLTFVDEYPVQEILRFDIVMAYFLVGLFLTISALLLINLLIALLSDTFKRIYDEAKANAKMERAKIIINIEEEVVLDKYWKRYKDKFESRYNPYKKNFSYAKPTDPPTEHFTYDDMRQTINECFKKFALQQRGKDNKSADDAEATDDMTFDFDKELKSHLKDMASGKSAMNRMIKRLNKLERKLDTVIQNTADQNTAVPVDYD